MISTKYLETQGLGVTPQFWQKPLARTMFVRPSISGRGKTGIVLQNCPTSELNFERLFNFMAKANRSSTGVRRCVVIGAGLAGLGAAYRLTQAGWHVTVLEARDRLGGRVWTYRFSQCPSLTCEMGAEWIGRDHRRLLGLCAELGVRLEPHAFRNWLLVGDRLRKPGEWGFSPSAHRAWAKLCHDWREMTPTQRLPWDGLDWRGLLGRYGFNDADLRIRDLIDSLEVGESIRSVSALGAALEFSDRDYMNPAETSQQDLHVCGGNSVLVEAVGNALRPGSILKNAEVVRVEQDGREVSVRTTAGVHKADACVCTVPTSVLDRITFSPALPMKQAEAASRLQYSRIAKTNMLFDRRFWPVEDFSVVTDRTAQQFLHSTYLQSQGGPGILCSYTTGDKADVIASQTKRSRETLLLRDLAPLTAERAPTVLATECQAWQDDQFSRGAYALYRPGQWTALRPILQAPHGHVLFAGDHLAEEQGYMEGALATGEDAAAVLIHKAAHG